MDKVLDTLLSQHILHGFNLLTILGFIVMGIGLNQSRQGRARAPIAFTLMAIGTLCVVGGMYFGKPGS